MPAHAPDPPPAARRLALALALALVAALSAGCAREAARPNLLLVTVDTLRADHLACYGGAADVGRVPCALAEDGVRFAWAFSTAPSTAPSVASILTSRLPHAHGVEERAASTLSGDAETLAEVLAGAGYATGAFVANPVLAGGRGFEQGFSVYDDRMQRRERHRPLLEREAGELTDAALAWLRVARAPWFLWVHYQDPHGPYDPPGAPPARDAPGSPQLAVLADESGWRGIPAYQYLDGARAPATYEARYADEIRWLDRHLARLLAGADAGGRAAVLLTADHGEAFGEDEFWLAHGHSLGVDQIRVPLLWRGPEPAAARVEAAPASGIDVAPTLVAAARLTAPSAFTGAALASVDGAPLPPRALFAEHRLRIAVLVGRHYFARDRRPLAGPVPEPITGGSVPPLPPRSATLAADGTFRGYDESPPPEAAGLERLAAGFLAGAESGNTAGSGQRRELDGATREALRALGYLE